MKLLGGKTISLFLSISGIKDQLLSPNSTENVVVQVDEAIMILRDCERWIILIF